MSALAKSLFICLAMLSSPLLAADEIVFSTAPTQPPEVTEELFGPLIEYLSEQTGQKIVLEPAHNFLEYSNKMRKGEYDLLFDGPHFVSWRMERMGYVPLARLPGHIKIVVITNKNSDLRAMQDLGRSIRRVCAFSSPNMLTMAFLSYFPDPARQPAMIRSQGFKDLEQCLREGKGDAAVVRDKHWSQMNKEGLRILDMPERSYPERTFSISPDVDITVRDSLAAALVSDGAAKKAEKLLARFNKKTFVRAQAHEYDGLGKLLHIVWGFR